VDGESFQARQQADVLPQFDIVMFALALGVLQGAQIVPAFQVVRRNRSD